MKLPNAKYGFMSMLLAAGLFIFGVNPSNKISNMILSLYRISADERTGPRQKCISNRLVMNTFSNTILQTNVQLLIGDKLL
ncbi:MAG: hypothetical protein M3297_14615 [Thermoproteota archaeon]|nr:hypothetical protein [Thermoproteota archaeon]